MNVSADTTNFVDQYGPTTKLNSPTGLLDVYTAGGGGGRRPGCSARSRRSCRRTAVAVYVLRNKRLYHGPRAQRGRFRVGILPENDFGVRVAKVFGMGSAMGRIRNFRRSWRAICSFSASSCSAMVALTKMDSTDSP
jgi:hypothetical protein